MKTFKRIKLQPHLIIYLNYRVVQQFLTDIENTFKRRYKLQSDAQLYGYDAYDPLDFTDKNKFVSIEMRSIKYAVSTSDRVKKLWLTLKDAEGVPYADKNILKLFDAKYLWKKKEAAKKDSQKPITFLGSYLSVLFAYINLNSLAASTQDEATAQLEQEYENDFEHYIGLYMSYTGFRIRSLIFSVSKSPLMDGKHIARMHGVHVRENYNDIEAYFGTGNFESRFLNISLKGEQYRRTLNFVIAESEQEMEGRKYIRGILQGTTTEDDRIFAWEVFLLKTTKAEIDKAQTKTGDPQGPFDLNKIDYSTLQTISYYLSLHRNVIAVGSKEVTQPNKLTANKHTVSTFTQLCGVYRLWNFSYGQNTIAQSRFEIKEDGTARLFPFFPTKDQKNNDDSGESSMRIVLKEQNSVLDISKVNLSKEKHKLIATTYSSGINIVNVAMFNFESNQDAIITGSFSTLGFDGYGNIAGYFVMQRVQFIKDVAPCEFTFEQILVEAATGPKKLLLEALLNLQNRNVWEKVRAQAAQIDMLINAVNPKP